MKEMEMGFGFRIPYQCLIDAELLAEATRCKIPLVKALEQTLGVKEGQVKPMITQCSSKQARYPFWKNELLT
jgi:U3 small nucleolar RNA-associated protein 23